MKETRIGVLHLIDSLASGGAEQMAVLLANNLPCDGYRVYLCASRQAGPLQSQIRPHVVFYDLCRKSRFDFAAIWRLSSFIRQEKIYILHAHTTSLFLGAVLCLLDPKLRLIWHDHFGNQEVKSRPVYLYLPFAQQARTVFTVTRTLADWCVRSLALPRERVVYLPNFVEAQPPVGISFDLPGETGKRLVCVANIRRQKDHLTLLRAFAQVIQVEPQAHLFLIGAETDPNLAVLTRQEGRRLGLDSNLSWLGPRSDVPLILGQCDMGVLGSVSEGFPVVLLEYGRAGLAVVATNVGECAEILENGQAGLLVQPSTPNVLAAAILSLLESPALRKQYAERLTQRVQQNYSVEVIVSQVSRAYERILQESRRAHAG